MIKSLMGDMYEKSIFIIPKIKHMLRVLMVFLVFYLAQGQKLLWSQTSEKPGTVSSRTDRYQDSLKDTESDLTKRARMVGDYAESLCQEDFVFSADTLIDRFLNQYYLETEENSRTRLLAINRRIDSLTARYADAAVADSMIHQLDVTAQAGLYDDRSIQLMNHEKRQIFYSYGAYGSLIEVCKTELEQDVGEALPDVMMDLSIGYYHLGLLDSALQYADLGYSCFEKREDTAKMAFALSQKATFLLRMGQERKAGKLYQRAFELADSGADILMKDLTANFLAAYYENTGRPEKAVPVLRSIMERKSEYPVFGTPFNTSNQSISQFIRAETAVKSLVRQRQKLWILGLIILLSGVIALLVFRLQSRKREAELMQQITRIQINPHFIFNSLNSLQRFIIENDIHSSNKYLTRFSGLIRSVLENSQENFIPVSDEVNFLDNYLALEQLRFKNRFSFDIRIDPSVDKFNMLIPTMIVQPFVENSLWHGLVPLEGQGRIDIEWTTEDLKSLICTITDNGVGRKPGGKDSQEEGSPTPGLGTKLVKQRLDQLSKIHHSRFSFSYTDLLNEDLKPGGTKVTLKIPVKWKKKTK